MNIIFFGAPGVGKGTQADLLAQRRNIPHISTGAIFRAALLNGTPLGLEAKRYMDNGVLVPDQLTTAIAVEALNEPRCLNGFLLDGYPRNLVQSCALDDVLREQGRGIDLVIYLTAPIDELVKRMLGRGRTDDNEDVIRTRFEVYDRETAPVLEHYRNTARVAEINGVGEIEEVYERIAGAVESGLDRP